MQNFESLITGSSAAHGHLCPGQVVGVRMALLGCRLTGLDDPSSRQQIKELIVYVEMDRCTADAIAYVTGVKLGRRSLKFMDYGIMAATFVNLETGKAFRVLPTEESRDLADVYAPEIQGKHARQLEAYKRMPDSALFRVQRIDPQMKEADMPVPSRYKTNCERCGQIIRDGREFVRGNQVLCKPCTRESYFRHAREITWPQMDWSPMQGREPLPTGHGGSSRDSRLPFH